MNTRGKKIPENYQYTPCVGERARERARGKSKGERMESPEVKRFIVPAKRQRRNKGTPRVLARVGQKREGKKIIDHPDLEIYWPSRITVVGFLIAWLFVILIITGTMILARIGA